MAERLACHDLWYWGNEAKHSLAPESSFYSEGADTLLRMADEGWGQSYEPPRDSKIDEAKEVACCASSTTTMAATSATFAVLTRGGSRSPQ